MHRQDSSLIMCEIDWINIASKSLAFSAKLIQQISLLKEKLEKLQEEAKKQSQLIQELTERHGGYDTVY